MSSVAVLSAPIMSTSVAKPPHYPGSTRGPLFCLPRKPAGFNVASLDYMTEKMVAVSTKARKSRSQSDDNCTSSSSPSSRSQAIEKPVRHELSQSATIRPTSPRRSIFSKYWTTDTKVHPLQPSSSNHHPTNSHRPRSSSLSIIETINDRVEDQHDYRMFIPTKEISDRSRICRRFASVDPSPKLDSLPPLPTPLLRLYGNETSPRYLGGIYPIVTPTSILRPSKYSSATGRREPKSGRSTSTKAEPSSSLRSDRRTDASHHMQFDPRVTVTEFDDHVERSWYSESELERLKVETLSKVHRYLFAHPELEEKYGQLERNPVTGTYRKRPIFSIPILSADGEETPLPLFIHNNRATESEVRNVLVVDPNPAILTLFCKSLASMFPHACVCTAQTGEEALSKVHEQLNVSYTNSAVARRNFDIIIVENQLQRMPTKERSSERHHHIKQSMSLNSSKTGAASPFQDLYQQNSFCGCDDSAPCEAGSDLIRSLLAVENRVLLTYNNSSNKSNNSTTRTSSPVDHEQSKGRALIIGVSMHPNRDGDDLRRVGADLVWGKPIPRVGASLRNHLLRRISEKRLTYRDSPTVYRR